MKTKSSEDKESTLMPGRYKWPLFVIIVLATLAIIASFVFRTPEGQVYNYNSNNTPPPVSEDIDQENPVFLRIGLAPLADCDAVLNYYKENALERVTPWGLRDEGYHFGPGIDFIAEDAAVSEEAVTTDSAGTQPGSTGGEAGYSTTNIQVEGVDEADIVKTDGDYIYVLSNQVLKIIGISGEQPEVVAEAEIDFYAADMLLSLKPEGEADLSDTLIIVGRPSWQQIRLVQIDIDDRQAPEVTADFSIDGDYVGIRLADNIVRLVAASRPLGFDWETPSGSGLRAQDEALAANKEIIFNSELSNWMPAYKDNLVADSRASPLMDCSRLLAPNVFSGLNTLSIITFNASKQLDGGDWQPIGLAADGHDIYATAEHVYVATAETAEKNETAEDEPATEPSSVTADLKTIIHKFGLEQAEDDALPRPIYMASGEVVGTLLNQFSMDEYQGDLRVAVTIENFRENAQENHIKILRPNQGILEEIGTIPGLGIDERIFAVRFMGPQAYIVTFRQIDPLYALDLSDPTDPKALGELKITGFSSYLHPVGDNLLLGIGQEADEDGVIEGLQISLFDTSDPTDPQRVSQLLVEDISDSEQIGNADNVWSSSPVEDDHRAFLFYENSSFIPYRISWSSYSAGQSDWGNDAGILVVGVEDDELAVENTLKAATEDSKQTDREGYLEPIRTIVVGDSVYGITGRGELAVWQASTGELLHILPY